MQGKLKNVSHQGFGGAVPREYLGAFKKGHRKSSREYIDEDLSIDLLKKASAGCLESKKALEWLTRFNNEFHKAVIPKSDPNNLHNTPKLRRDCNSRNYARRWDLFTHAFRVEEE